MSKCKLGLTLWDVLLLTEVVGAVWVTALRATAPSAAQEMQLTSLTHSTRHL